MQETPWTIWFARAGIVAAGLAGWFWSQRLIGQRPSPVDHIDDRAHEWTASLNRSLHAHPRRADAFLILTSATIDLLGLFLVISAILGPTFRPFIGLFLLFALRQACQGMNSLPRPRGSIWRYPGFPALLVTYDTSSDLFFSGHTAIAVYGAIELIRLGDPIWVAAGLFVATLEVFAVLILRAHYTMDVFAAIVTALWVAGIAEIIAPYFDGWLAGWLV